MLKSCVTCPLLLNSDIYIYYYVVLVNGVLHDPPAASTLPSLVPPPLPRPTKGGRAAFFSLRALLVEDCTLPNLSMSVHSSCGL